MDNACANLLPMEQWIADDKQGECRPCLLGPVVQWYRDTLDESGQKELASKLEKVSESANSVELCHELDQIKKAVPEEIRQRLVDYDCSAQRFENYDEMKGGDQSGEDSHGSGGGASH